MNDESRTLRRLCAIAGALLCPPAALHGQSGNADVTIVGKVCLGAERLAGATVAFHPTPRLTLDCLESIEPILTRAVPVKSVVSGADGGFRLSVRSRRGALLIFVPSRGLGAMVVNPQNYQSVTCRPLGEVRFAGECEVHVQIVDPRGRRIYLGVHPKVTRLRLPDGEYHLLVSRGREIGERHLRVFSGKTLDCEMPDGPGRGLQLGVDFRGRAHLSHWPAVNLGIDSVGLLRMPSGEGPLRVVVVERRAECELIHRRWIEKGRADSPTEKWRFRKLRILDPKGAAIFGARVLSATLTKDGLSVHAIDSSDTEGHATLGIPEIGHTPTVIVQARGFAACIAELESGEPLEVTLRAGHRLRLQCFDPSNGPAQNSPIGLRWPGAPLRNSTAWTDDRGTVRLTNLPAGALHLRFMAPQFLDEASALTVTAAKGQRAVLRAERGSAVTGRVLLPNGKPAIGAIVTVSPITAGLAKTRTAVTDAQGNFRAVGLREYERVRVSARHSARNVDYISKKSLGQAGDDIPWRIRLRREDPTLPTSRKH